VLVVAVVKRNPLALVAVQLLSFFTVDAEQFDVFNFLALEANLLKIFLF